MRGYVCGVWLMRYDDGNRHAVPIDGGWFGWIDDGLRIIDGIFGTHEDVMAWLGLKKESESVRHRRIRTKDGSVNELWCTIDENGDVVLFPPVKGRWIVIPHEDVDTIECLEG